MWVGCGYPKSGTVWLCQLLSAYLDLPHPRRYRVPVAMPSVLHAHWLPNERLPRTVYIVRDGRDVMVSLYFYEVRLANSPLNPRAARSRQERFNRILGPRADLSDVRSNLARFVEAEMEQPAWMSATWQSHVDAWLQVPPERAAVVRYEDLLQDVQVALAPALEQLTHGPVDLAYLRMAGERFEFARQAGLASAHEGRGPYLRKGISGDWKNYFDSDAERVFEQAAGQTLKRLGYSDPPDEVETSHSPVGTDR
jgi:hypothetical protein